VGKGTVLGVDAWAKSSARRAHANTTANDFAHPTGAAPASADQRLDVNFQEVVHSALTGNADVAKPQ